jgi:lysophospholipase L1-like esterase
LLLALLLATAQSLLWAQTADVRRQWVSTWSSAQFAPWGQAVLPAEDLHDATLRESVHLSLGGSTLRVRLSNVTGTAPLHLLGVHIARPVDFVAGSIDPVSDRALTFSGAADVTIPAGADYLSDPVELAVAPLSMLTVSIRFDAPPSQQSYHSDALSYVYMAHGDQLAAPVMAAPKRVEHWYQLAGIEVQAPENAAVVIALGDSITDGYGATVNGNARWTDVLAQRMQADPSTRNLALINEGIGGNHLLTDGIGPSALSRFDRDVLAQPGARFLVVFEGINDLGALSREGDVPQSRHDDLVHRMIASFEQIAARAHAHGLKVIAATIMPDIGSDYYHPAPVNENDRVRVNQWIRSATCFDGLVDFDKAMSDPQNPGHILPAYDSGDHLHPSPAGYKVMGEAVPLTLFAR